MAKHLCNFVSLFPQPMTWSPCFDVNTVPTVQPYTTNILIYIYIIEFDNMTLSL